MQDQLREAVRYRRGLNPILSLCKVAENERQAGLRAELAALEAEFFELIARRNTAMRALVALHGNTAPIRSAEMFSFPIFSKQATP